MITPIEQFSPSPIEQLIDSSGVKFTAKDLKSVLPRNSTFRSIGGETLAKLLLERGIYLDINVAWDDVCKMKRSMAGMKLS